MVGFCFTIFRNNGRRWVFVSARAALVPRFVMCMMRSLNYQCRAGACFRTVSFVRTSLQEIMTGSPDPFFGW